MLSSQFVGNASLIFVPSDRNILHRPKTSLAFKLGDFDFDTRAGVGRRGFGNIASQLRRSTGCRHGRVSLVYHDHHIRSASCTHQQRESGQSRRLRRRLRRAHPDGHGSGEIGQPARTAPRRTLLVQVLVAVFVERRRARQAAGLGSSNKHLDLEVDVGLSGKRPRSLERLSDPLDLRCNCVERLEGSALSHA